MRWTPFFLAISLGLLAGAATLVLLLRKEGEPLTAESLRAARARWAAEGPDSYEMEVVVSGRREATHRVSVERGEVRAMTTDGREVPARVWATWSVEGLFRTLESELSLAAEADRAYDGAAPGDVVLRAVFDERFGYPRRFFRHVLGRERSIEWDVREFRLRTR